MTLKNQKHQFDIPDDITYLNIAAQSPAFKSIYEAGLEGLKQKSRPYKIQGSDYFEPVTELKKLFAKLIDADDYNSIASLPSVSYGMATIANNIVLNEGDEILVIDEQFPSNMYSWQKLAKTYNAKIVVIEAPETTEQWNQNV
jgi:selenocysteine lyase/cysteine desulfurase